MGKIKKNQSLYLAVLLLIFSGASQAEDEIKISTKDGITISGGNYQLYLGGRIQYDYNKTEGDKIDRTGSATMVPPTADTIRGNVNDEEMFDIRRARIHIKGTISNNWAFKSQFSVHESEVHDLYLRYKGLGNRAVLTIGNQKMPFMLEQMSSSNDISILERSAITERYALGREEGITLAGSLFKNSTYALGVYLRDKTGTEDSETGFATRLTAAPIKFDRSLIHLGLGYHNIKDNNALGIELSGVFGPFHAQAEWVDADEDNNSVDGYYIQLGYVLTGEIRPYKKGVFKRIKPKSNGGFGAWELGARYEDGDGDYGDIELGKVDGSAYTIGLNWYAPNNNIRFGINYTDGDTDSILGILPVSGTPLVLTQQRVTLEGSELRLRIQLTF